MGEGTEQSIPLTFSQESSSISNSFVAGSGQHVSESPNSSSRVLALLVPSPVEGSFVEGRCMLLWVHMRVL